jgi:hypothetical protein
LYIVDIIALWGEQTYKPFAGACIQRLRATLENTAPPPLEDTLLAHQLEINNENFPWLFPEQENSSLPTPSESLPRENIRRTRSQDRINLLSPGSASLVREVESLSLTSSPKPYLIPERDPFTWLLDRDSVGADLLIVRVGEDGSVLPPLVVFDSEDWEELDFRRVLKEELARYSDDVSTEFKCRRNGSPYMDSCISSGSGYFRKPQCQFCAIIPLDSKTYQKQLDFTADTVFGDLESLLDLPGLIETAEKTNDKWCTCRAPYNEYSPDMILCDNLKCSLGWYHKKCQGLDEDFDADEWLCSLCRPDWRKVDYGDFQTREVSEEIREASDARIQWTKTLGRVWQSHPWPSRGQVLHLINRIAVRININQRFPYNTLRDVRTRPIGESLCWAIMRTSPKVMFEVKPSEGDASAKTTKKAHQLQHRKSDCGMSSIAARNISLTPQQVADKLSFYPWNQAQVAD